MTNLPSLNPIENLGIRVDAAIAAAKRADLPAVRTLLQIPSSAAADAQVLDALIALSEGLALFQQDRATEASRMLQRANAVLRQSTDPELQVAISLVNDLATGISMLIGGDAVGAHSLLNISAERLNTLAFFNPVFFRVALKSKALSHIALSRAAINVGNLSQAEHWIGQSDQVHDELLRSIHESDPERSTWLTPILATRLEVAITFARVDYESLDLEAAKKRLDAAQTYAVELSKQINDYPQPLTKQLLLLVSELYSAFVRLHPVMVTVLVNRNALSSSDIKELAEIDKSLFQMRQIAQASGDQGAVYLYTINQFARITHNLLSFGAVTKSDFGRFAGLISLGSLTILLVVTHFTIQPTGWSAAGYFLGDLVISLIVGFGYGALKFRPLLTLISDALKPRSENDSTKNSA